VVDLDSAVEEHEFQIAVADRELNRSGLIGGSNS
jgi:hypothetical protein